MNNKKNYKKGMRKRIMQIVLFCGALPREMLNCVDGSVPVYKRMLHKMIEEGILKDTKVVLNRETHHIITVNNYSDWKQLLTGTVGARYCETYETISALSARKMRSSDVHNRTSALREILFTGTQLFAMFSGASTSIDGAPSLLTIDAFDDSFYYTSKEIKRYSGHEPIIGREDKDNAFVITDKKGKTIALSESRFMGTLFSPGGNYVLYNFHKGVRKLSVLGEKKIKTTVFDIVQEKSPIESLDGIVLAKDFKALYQFLSDKNTADRYLGFHSVYDNLYTLPFSQEGRKHMEIMQQLDWKDKIRLKYFGGFSFNTTGTVSGCDAVRNGKLTNIFIFPDVAKLHSFALAADSPETYYVCCFDYQRDFVESLTQGRCKILTIPLFQAYEDLVKKG